MSPAASSPARLPVCCTARRQRADENSVSARSRNSSASRLADLVRQRALPAARPRRRGRVVPSCGARGADGTRAGWRANSRVNSLAAAAPPPACTRAARSRARARGGSARRRARARSVSARPDHDRRRRLRHQRRRSVQRRIGLQVEAGLAVAERAARSAIGARQIAVADGRDAIVGARRRSASSPGALRRRRCLPTARRTPAASVQRVGVGQRG